MASVIVCQLLCLDLILYHILLVSSFNYTWHKTSLVEGPAGRVPVFQFKIIQFLKRRLLFFSQSMLWYNHYYSFTQIFMFIEWNFVSGEQCGPLVFCFIFKWGCTVDRKDDVIRCWIFTDYGELSKLDCLERCCE